MAPKVRKRKVCVFKLLVRCRGHTHTQPPLVRSVRWSGSFSGRFVLTLPGSHQCLSGHVRHVGCRQRCVAQNQKPEPQNCARGCVFVFVFGGGGKISSRCQIPRPDSKESQKSPQVRAAPNPPTTGRSTSGASGSVSRDLALPLRQSAATSIGQLQGLAGNLLRSLLKLKSALPLTPTP